MRYISILIYSLVILFLYIEKSNAQDLIISCPQDTLVSDELTCSYVLTDFTVLASVTHINNIQSFTQNPPAGTVLLQGIHAITLTVEDDMGNIETCSFTVQVADTFVPKITCPADTIFGSNGEIKRVIDTLSSCNPVFIYDLPITSDNCTIASLTQIDGTGLSSASTFPEGVTKQTYQVTDDSGNSSMCSFYVEILENPKANILTPDTSLCDIQNYTLEAQALNSGTGFWIVKSSGPSVVDINNNITSVTGLTYGENIFVWLVHSEECGSASDTVRIFVDKAPSLAQTQAELYVCSDTLINVSATVPTYGIGSWTSAEGNVKFLDYTKVNTVAYHFNEGWNSLLWVVSSGVCPASIDTLRIYKKEQVHILTNDTSFCLPFQGMELYGTDPNGSGTVLWYSIDGNTEFSDETTSHPTLQKIGAGENRIVYGFKNPVCGTSTDTLYIMAKICDEYNPIIPTMITPNGDGKNDLFVIQDLNILYPKSNITIVNRWGKLVFESEGYPDPWNGTYLNEGNELPMGTYFYKIKLNNSENQELSGSISIIR
ncbi:MAG: gliding motility-associated C-terminal domain-containing protein [Brumimicrobium sp.]|nr:gliding motility-associated C-terminal domain-containing protein [Brumimicrobium sp.]